MAGKNQHYIPQFFQSGFAVDGSNGNKIWRIEKKDWVPTRPGATKSSASEDWFYSKVSTDGGRTLDDEITDQEGPLAALLSSMRGECVGGSVESGNAANLVNHLAPRTAHFRRVMAQGMRLAVGGVERLFSDSERLKSVVGINQQEPNDVFRSHVGNVLRKNEALASLALPESVVERIAFYMAKEQFEVTLEGNSKSAFALLSKVREGTGEIARSGHNRALSKNDEPNERHAFLNSLKWRVIAGPEEGAILPDCVALALDQKGIVGPFMFTGLDECDVVVMPLDNEKLLVGEREGAIKLQPFDFNREAARSSHSFFLSSTKSENVQSLQPLIGEGPARIIHESVDRGIDKFAPSALCECNESEDMDGGQSYLEKCEIGAPIRFQISFLNCLEGADAQRVADEIVKVINELRLYLPLNRLEGITFAADYPKALQEIDRGVAGIAQPVTTDGNVGKGIGQEVIIVRDERVMSRIVMDRCVCDSLISDDEHHVAWAAGLLTRQIISVALTEVVDDVLPGVWLQPIPDYYTGALYRSVSGVGESYISSYLCAGFGGPHEQVADLRQLLTDALTHMSKTVVSARRSYRHHGDLDKLLGFVMPLFRHVLLFSADLLGLSAALGVEAVPKGSQLEGAISRAGLKLWLNWYRSDLEIFRLHFGRWESFDDFTYFNVHVERMMWQFGMIPWKSGEVMRVEIPFGSDAEYLMADLVAAKFNDS